MGDVTRPQQDPKPGRTRVDELVVKDIDDRVREGIKKYGSPLMTQNGRDALVDAYQEALDLVMYLRQAIAERDESKLDAIDMMIEPIKEDRYAWPPDSLTSTSEKGAAGVSESIAQEAHRLVLGDRGEAYGHPIFDMTRSADLLTALLRNKLRPGVRLEAEDIGQAMVMVKQSRHRNKAKRDNLTDTAGYALTLQMIADWRKDHPGVDPRDVFPAS
jgi:hypothetical protein